MNSVLARILPRRLNRQVHSNARQWKPNGGTEPAKSVSSTGLHAVKPSARSSSSSAAATGSNGVSAGSNGVNAGMALFATGGGVVVAGGVAPILLPCVESAIVEEGVEFEASEMAQLCDRVSENFLRKLEHHLAAGVGTGLKVYAHLANSEQLEHAVRELTQEEAETLLRALQVRWEEHENCVDAQEQGQDHEEESMSQSEGPFSGWVRSLWSTIAFAQAVEDEQCCAPEPETLHDQRTWTEYVQSFVCTNAVEAVQTEIEEEAQNLAREELTHMEQEIEEVVYQQQQQQKGWLDTIQLHRLAGWHGQVHTTQ